MPDVACLGILVADAVARPVEELPERGKLVLVEEISLSIGGCAANTGVGLARLGIPTSVLGLVGQDAFGQFVTQTLQREHIDTRGVQRTRKAATSATLVLVDADGERSFIHYAGANAVLREEDVAFKVIAEARLLHIGGALLMPQLDGEPTARLLQRARAAGIVTSLDTVWDAKGRWLEVLAPCLPHVDYFLPSIEEARQITRRENPADIAAALLDAGVRVVGLKMGEEGCYVRTADEELRLPAFAVEALDATGAGDAFVAGFLAGVLLGWDLEQTARLANATGALCVTGIGAIAGLRSLAETKRFMAEATLRG